jgi:hypothetical protein
LYREIWECRKRTVEFPETSRVLRETSEVPGENHRVEEESCGVSREILSSHSKLIEAEL